jgi:hypothetical protein
MIQLALEALTGAAMIKRNSASIAVVIAIAGVLIWQSGWNPFRPKNYEECLNKVSEAKSQYAADILVSACASQFLGRRSPRGGYDYRDPRSDQIFSIEGPNPNHDEWARIEKAYAEFLKDAATAADEKRKWDADARRSAWELEQLAQKDETERRRQAQIAEAKLEQRRKLAVAGVTVKSASLLCLYPALNDCESFKLTATIQNNSVESISSLQLGWAFIETTEACPTTVPPKHTEDISLAPGGSIALNIDGFGGPGSKYFRYCVKVIDAQILP